MAANAQQQPPQGDGRPPKPWEQSSASGSSQLRLRGPQNLEKSSRLPIGLGLLIQMPWEQNHGTKKIIWISFLQMQGVVIFFGCVSILVDQNTRAFHLFMTALLQPFDHSGMLCGELARFVLRLLWVKMKPRKVNQW